MPVDNVIAAHSMPVTTVQPVSPDLLAGGYPKSANDGATGGFFNNMFGALRRIFPNGPLAGEYGVKSSQPVLSPFQANPVPEPQPTQRPAQTTAQLGGSGTPIYAGFVTDLGEYNGKLQGSSAFPTYEKMRRSDPDCHAGINATKLPIRCAQYQVIPGVTPASPLYNFAVEIADMVRENLFGGLETMSSTGFYHGQTFESVLENALLCIDFGCSSHEILWHVDQDKVRIRRLAPMLPMTFFRFYPDKDGQILLALEQYGYRNDEYVNVIIPSEKIDYFTYDKEGSDFYGRSALRYCYAPWYIKALALDTPVPTPNGWTTMGDVEVGQQIFAGDGSITEVEAKSQVFRNHVCYRVTFSNGASIVAGEDHQWMTQTLSERKNHIAAGRRTTKEIAATLTIQNGPGRVEFNHAMEFSGPVEYPERNLPIDPYILGLWLGDGRKFTGEICCFRPDVADEVELMKKHATNLVVKVKHPPSMGDANADLLVLYGLPVVLKEHNLHKNKHVPEIYRQSSVAQRKALVAGLLDSDGCACNDGVVHFGNSDPRLIDGFVEVLRSLGEEPKVYKHKKKKFDNVAKDFYIVAFSPRWNPFFLPRKQRMFEDRLPTNMRHRQYIKITSVERVPSVPLQCITVGHESHEFRVSPFFTRTCNSNLWRLDSIAIERNGMGIPVITMPENASDEDKGAAQAFVTSLAMHEQVGLTLPFGYDFKLVGMTGRIRDPKASIQHMSEQILRSFLAQFLAFGTTATGSRSLSQDMSTFFKLGLNTIARATTGTMSKSCIRRLVDFNYGDSRKQIPYPQLIHSNIAALDPMELAEKIKNLSQWQVDLLQPDDELENWFRHEYGLPAKTKMRVRWMPVQTRLMEQPAPGLTPAEIEAGKDPGGAPPVVEPINPTGGQNPPHPGTPVKQSYEPGVQPNPHREEGAKVNPVGGGGPAASMKAEETVELCLLLADKQPASPKIVVFDFDGTISIFPGKKQLDYVPGKFGVCSENARELMKQITAAGMKCAVVTARKDIEDTKAWIKAQKLPVVSVGNEKIPCLMSVDDRGCHISWGEDLDPAAVSAVMKALKKIMKTHGD